MTAFAWFSMPHTQYSGPAGQAIAHPVMGHSLPCSPVRRSPLAAMACLSKPTRDRLKRFFAGRAANPEADDADTTAIQALNEKVNRDERVDACLLPIGDGLTLAVKR